MVGREGVERIEHEVLRSLHDANASQRHRGNDSAFSLAQAAVAMLRIDDPIGQIQFGFHRAAVAHGPMLRLDGHSGNLLDHG